MQGRNTSNFLALQLRAALLPEGWSLVSGGQSVAKELVQRRQDACGGDHGPLQCCSLGWTCVPRLEQSPAWLGDLLGSYGTRLMAYRAADNHVYGSGSRVLDAAGTRVPSRGTRRSRGPGGLWRAGRARLAPDAYWRTSSPDSCEMKPVGTPDAEIRTSGLMSGDGKRGSATRGLSSTSTTNQAHRGL